MSSQRYVTGEQQSSTWLHKGLATITRIGRVMDPVISHGGTNPLREIFTDLIAFVIFFRSSAERQSSEVSELREKIITLANAQEERVKSAGIPLDSFREARFAVFSWVDEMILTSKWPQRGRWQHLMLTYYRTANAGEEFFRRLEVLPPHANDVREIYYLCLSLGFLGQYAFGEGPTEIKNLKQSLYAQLSSSKGDIRRSYSRLFPEAYQKSVTATPVRQGSKLLWYIMVLSLPVFLFIAYLAWLQYRADEVIAKIDKFGQPRPEIPRLSKPWSVSLVEELRRKEIRAVEEPDGVRITLETLLFTPGSAQLNLQARGQIDDIVATVKRYAPNNIIQVEGHASRERGADEIRNRKLSEERARTVAEAFTRSRFRSDRIFAEGFGSTKPLASNDTEQGRSQNRRVEITVKR